jgi:hypothetical protein
MREVTKVSGAVRELVIPPSMLEREPLLAELLPGKEEARKLADELETAVAELDACRRRVASAEAWVERISRELAAALDPGYGVQVPGALYFAAFGPDGAASVNEAVIRGLAAELEPFGLAPRREERLRFPTVAQVRRQRHALRAAGITSNLIVEPPLTVKLRRRSVGTGEVKP